jgi:hypothetical protein
MKPYVCDPDVERFMEPSIRAERLEVGLFFLSSARAFHQLHPREHHPEESTATPTERRARIVREMMESTRDFKDRAKVKGLFEMLDRKGIPLPRRKGPPHGWQPRTWSEIATRPTSYEYARAVNVLVRARFPR